MIGLKCDSGNITDCNESLMMYQNSSDGSSPVGCEKMLIFAANISSCGSYCEINNRRRRSIGDGLARKGWTLYSSVDEPDGTGDHENYFQQSTDVFDLNGAQYGNCVKKAVHIRSKNKHEPWFSLSGIYSDIVFLFSKDGKYTTRVSDSPHEIKYTRVLNPDYGLVLCILKFTVNFKLKSFFSIHCFNNYLGHGKCLDMEISYYIECSEEINVRKRRSEGLSCLTTTESFVAQTESPEMPGSATFKSVLILNTRADTNKPLITSFTS